MEARWNFLKSVFVYLSFIGSAVLISACGGGGGGGSSNTLPAAVNTYSGSSTNASITDQATAEDILISMTYSSQSNDLGQYTTAASTDKSGGTIGQDKIKNILAQKFKKDAENTAKQYQQQQAITATSHVVAGDCGTLLGSPGNGSANQGIIEQSNSRVVTDVTYNNLCTTDGSTFYVVMNGVMRITITGSNLLNASARINGISMYMPDITVGYTDLVTQETYQDRFTMSMSITFDYDADGFLIGGTTTISSNVAYLNDIYRFRYSLTDDGFTITEVDEFYHPVHGVVQFSNNVIFDDCGGALTNPVPIGMASVTNTSSDTGATFNSTCSLATGPAPGYEICLTDGAGLNPTGCTIYPW